MQKTSATLLIIDDDEVVRASLAAYLEDSGFSVLQASNGLQGLQVFERDKPDLVICDLRMPQVGGLELIRQVTDLSPQTPVIVVSGAGVMNDAVEALRLGAADYLIKPLEDLAVLEHSVRRALDRARLLLENQRYREKLETANRELEASLNLLQEDQNAGRQVQMNMLPVSPWSIDEFKFAHQIIPSLYLSGDFVDYFRVDERRVAFYLADVSGHGASSAFVTVLLKFMTTRLLFESKRNGSIQRMGHGDGIDVRRSCIEDNIILLRHDNGYEVIGDHRKVNHRLLGGTPNALRRRFNIEASERLGEIDAIIRLFDLASREAALNLAACRYRLHICDDVGGGGVCIWVKLENDVIN